MWRHLVTILQIVGGVQTHLMDQQRILPTSSQVTSKLVIAQTGVPLPGTYVYSYCLDVRKKILPWPRPYRFFITVIQVVKMSLEGYKIRLP